MTVVPSFVDVEDIKGELCSTIVETVCDIQ